jgi:hypothetical protein
MVSFGAWIAGAVLGLFVWVAAPDGPVAAAPAAASGTVYTVKVPGVG